MNFSISVTSDIATMKADSERAKEDMAAVKETLEILRESIKGVKKDINGIEDSVDDVAEEMEDVEDDVEDVEREMSHVKDELKDVEDDVEDVEDDVEDLEDHVDDVKDNVKDVKKCVEAMKEDTEIMKGAVEAIREDMGCVKEDMETLKNNLTAFWAELSRNTVEPPPVEPCLVEPPTILPTELPEPPSVGTEQDYHCGGTSGWKRVTHLNMTNVTHSCPTGWNERSYSNKRTCGRASAGRYTCDSAIFPVNGVEYSRVCGRVVAYQFGAVSAFLGSSMNIETRYVNGLGLTHGSAGNRSHIWTFAVGVSENPMGYINELCPCDGGTSPVPEFVGSDYFCESGLNGPWVGQFIFYPEDQLWDGEDCLVSSTCCSFNGPPYFIKEMGNATTDDIEARLCSLSQLSSSDIAVEFLELYVQ